MSKQLRNDLKRGDPAGAPRIEWAPIATIRPNPKNARTHSRKQIRQIAASIRKFGFLNPLIVDEGNMILAGHGRLEAARLEGVADVPIIRFDHLSEAQKRAYVIADNKIAEQAGWDREMLAIELGELIDLLPVEELDVSITGFETAEIDLLFADMASAQPGPEDVIPPFPETAVTRRGDLWLLGKHRLLCGDAREPKDFDRAMSGALAAAVFCDPPYNLRVRAIGGRGRVQHSEFAFASGEMSEAQFRNFLSQTLGNGVRVSVEGAVHFVCMDWRHIGELIEVGRELYGDMLNIVAWVKSNAGQGSFYRSQHEFIGVFRVGEEPHRNNVELGQFGRNRSNVWTYAGVNTFGKGRKEALAAHPDGQAGRAGRRRSARLHRAGRRGARSIRGFRNDHSGGGKSRARRRRHRIRTPLRRCRHPEVAAHDEAGGDPCWRRAQLRRHSLCSRDGNRKAQRPALETHRRPIAARWRGG